MVYSPSSCIAKFLYFPHINISCLFESSSFSSRSSLYLTLCMFSDDVVFYALMLCTVSNGTFVWSKFKFEVKIAVKWHRFAFRDFHLFFVFTLAKIQCDLQIECDRLSLRLKSFNVNNVHMLEI